LEEMAKKGCELPCIWGSLLVYLEHRVGVYCVQALIVSVTRVYLSVSVVLYDRSPGQSNLSIRCVSGEKDKSSLHNPPPIQPMSIDVFPGFPVRAW